MPIHLSSRAKPRDLQFPRISTKTGPILCEAKGGRAQTLTKCCHPERSEGPASRVHGREINLSPEIQLQRLNQRQQPAQQFQVHRILTISLKTGLIRELHHAAKSVSLPARRLILPDIGFQQPGNMPLKSANLHRSALDLLFSHTRLPAKSKAMNIHKRHLKVAVAVTLELTN